MPSLFDLMNQPSQGQSLAPLPTGNLGAGSSQPLDPSMGMMVADNSQLQDPKAVFAQSMRQGSQGGNNVANSLRQIFGFDQKTANAGDLSNNQKK